MQPIVRQGFAAQFGEVNDILQTEHPMKLISLVLAMTFAAQTSVAQPLTSQSGMAALEISGGEHSQNLEGFIWYPTQATGPVTLDFDSAVWVGSPVVRDAPPAKGVFPLIVVSHGMYGNAWNQAWFANALARQGYVVAAISHPGTSTWSRDPDQTRQLWERPRDISRVIDFVTASPEFADIIDPERIFMAGHSLGGFTAVALAGARYDADAFASFCDATPGDMVCDILNGWNIAKTDADRAQMEADLSDPRIKAFAVFDLGGVQSFSRNSFATITTPMLVFGAPVMNSGLTLDIESRALIEALTPGIARYIEPETLSHFDFLGQCKPGGYEILAKEEPGDERICDNAMELRAAKHQMIIEEVAAFFAQQ